MKNNCDVICVCGRLEGISETGTASISLGIKPEKYVCNSHLEFCEAIIPKYLSLLSLNTERKCLRNVSCDVKEYNRNYF
jgi:hypothetical protein